MVIVLDTNIFVAASIGPGAIALAEFDAETRFRARAALGSREEGLRMLDALDRES